MHDPFIIKAFAQSLDNGNKIDWIADGSGYLTQELGVGIDLMEAGFGIRCRRFTAMLEGGMVVRVWDDEGLGYDKCEAKKIIEQLA